VSGPIDPIQPPVPGPFWYLVVPYVKTVPVELQPIIITSQRLLVEHSLVGLKAGAERADLADGRRVYRTAEVNLAKMPKDQYGFWIWSGVKASPQGPTGTPTVNKMYWTPTSPITTADAIVRDWVLIE
jgi:hypothetical protein